MTSREITAQGLARSYAARARLADGEPGLLPELNPYLNPLGLIAEDVLEVTDLTADQLAQTGVTTLLREIIPAAREVNPDFFAYRLRVMDAAQTESP